MSEMVLIKNTRKLPCKKCYRVHKFYTVGCNFAVFNKEEVTNFETVDLVQVSGSELKLVCDNVN